MFMVNLPATILLQYGHGSPAGSVQPVRELEDPRWFSGPRRHYGPISMFPSRLGSRPVPASTESLINRQVRLAARPSGLPRATDWEFTSEAVPDPGPGQFAVAISHLSIDPAMRGWMNAVASYIPPVEISAVMRAGAVGRVTASEHPGFAVGDDVYGVFGVQEYAVSDGRGVIKIDTLLAGPATYLGALGTSGLTAYFGLLDTGKLKQGCR
jgi:NADPH-dependent curcumin reductase CurA